MTRVAVGLTLIAAPYAGFLFFLAYLVTAAGK
jgi:hypothetical protein